MFGDLNATATLPVTTMQADNYTMVGTGITPEAIENNPIMFNLMFEMGWRSATFDIDEWVRSGRPGARMGCGVCVAVTGRVHPQVANYTMRRYGCSPTKPCPTAQQGWAILRRTVYQSAITESIIHHSPALSMSTNTQPNATAVTSVFRLWRQVHTCRLGMDTSLHSQPRRVALRSRRPLSLAQHPTDRSCTTWWI